MSILKKAEAIISGWSHYLQEDTVDPETIRRAKICASCPKAKKKPILQWVGDDIKEIEGYLCTQCECPISAKIRQDVDRCPFKKW